MDFPQHGEVFYFYGQALVSDLEFKKKFKLSYNVLQSVSYTSKVKVNNSLFSGMITHSYDIQGIIQFALKTIQ
jgi:hypothetical protein